MEDDHVDRPQVEALRDVEPSGTNCPRAWAYAKPVRPLAGTAGIPLRLRGRGTGNWERKTFRFPLSTFHLKRLPSSAKASKETSGGYDAGAHLFPFRTEKLSPAVPMILH